MLTKEELLDSIRKADYFRVRGEEMPELFYVNKNSALEAMDQYAKQQSMLFADWISNHRLDYQRASGLSQWIGLDLKIVSTTELYDKFLEEQSPQQ